MYKTFREIMAELPKERVEKIHKRANEIRAELALREIRWTTGVTQEKIAQKLKINQSSISKLESRKDINIHTLEEYVKALGGELELYVKLPNDIRFKLKHTEDKKKTSKTTKKSAQSNGKVKKATVTAAAKAAKKGKNVDNKKALR